MKTDRPTLNFTNASDGVDVQIAFGYHAGEPTAALFYKEALVLIPREILQIAFEQGWPNRLHPSASDDPNVN